ncbi:hypothetical protein NAC44_07815 [Allorhizobium sp. BGMRC 0089]|uniref:hypothetical protein n=1 Tax=Allorhizobium sonneratiae TaxID=2934936 RepID=UPI0020332D9F|nr:hypothetical protein [Allorhizobium sonneratiae]MCM2292232.1 hypothetical protein [Allorhizobium sonneratiae]
MTDFLRHLSRIAFLVVMVANPMASHAEDAFKSFRELQNSTKQPKLNAFSIPQSERVQGTGRLIRFDALLDKGGQPVQDGLEWRVFSPIVDSHGKLPMVASSEGGSADLMLAPGDYFLNVSFGRAGVTRRLHVPEEGAVERQVVVLNAGGLVLNAVSGKNSLIKPANLKFKIYAAQSSGDDDHGLIIDDVQPNTLVGLNAGTYNVVSEYGNVNAVVHASIKVEAGKITEATLQHRAAQISFKLVSEPGSEAIADTAWSILTSSGDAVAESVSAYPVLVLSEGNYTAIARNKDRIYQQEFTVTAGRNTDVEVLMKEPGQVSRLPPTAIDAN